MEENDGWMDDSLDSYAYHYLSLVIANTHSWEILNTVKFQAKWMGGNNKAGSEVQAQKWQKASFTGPDADPDSHTPLSLRRRIERNYT